MTAQIKRSYPRDCITSEQGRKPCTCGALNTANSDGSSSDESRDLTDIALDFVAVILVIAVLVFILFGVAGFASAYV